MRQNDLHKPAVCCEESVWEDGCLTGIGRLLQTTMRERLIALHKTALCSKRHPREGSQLTGIGRLPQTTMRERCHALQQTALCRKRPRTSDPSPHTKRHFAANGGHEHAGTPAARARGAYKIGRRPHVACGRQPSDDPTSCTDSRACGRSRSAGAAPRARARSHPRPGPPPAGAASRARAPS